MRCQIISVDLSVSILLFISFFAAAALMFQFMLSESYEIRTLDYMNTLSFSVSDALVRTAGLPEGWNSSYVVSVGFASEDGVIDYGKLEEFSLMDYSAASEAIGTEGFDFFISIENRTSEILSYGIGPPEDSFASASARYCLLENNSIRTPVVFRFVLWSEAS